MKAWLARLALLGALLALGIWGWRAAFPGPEQLIRKRLAELARLASFTQSEGSLVKLAKAQQLAARFTPDAEISVDLPGRSPQSLNGRDELMQAAMSARTMVKSLKVQFVDVTVKLGDAPESGIAHFTVKADVPGETTPEVEELEAQFKRVDGDWLIQHVQNVRTLR